MPIYAWETHAHTGEISPCGNVPAAELAEHHIEAGYSGVVITNHFSRYGFTYVADKSWEEQVNWFYRGYEMVKEAAGDRLTVLFGAEINFIGDPNDYLVYGITPAFMLAHPDLLSMGVGHFSKLSRENGFLLIQAHPFRNGMRIVRPDELDGIEVCNGNPRHDSRNFIAGPWATRYGLLTTSGSDYHQREDIGRGGIFTERKIETMEDFIGVIRSRPALRICTE